MAVAMVDAAYITLAALGVTRWARKPSVRRALQWGGACVVALFGLEVLMSSWGAHLPPSLGRGSTNPDGANPFVAALLLTGSNPLTIVFWAGVFGAKLATNRFGRNDVVSFSVGCVLATLVFLTAVTSCGALAGRFLPQSLVRMSNAVVGVAMLYFAIRLVARKTSESEKAG
jgi:threonine/homoserine/homoserine lactone efflux protein